MLDVGRHGGVVIGGKNGNEDRCNTSGFVLDYIDRNDPTGFRFYHGNV